MNEDGQETEGLRKKKIGMGIDQLLADGITVETGEDVTVIIKDEAVDVSV
jgi:hypothetical protein